MSRPMPLQESDDRLQSEDGAPSRRETLEVHHRQTLWVPWTLIVLGVWTATAPVTFGYLDSDLWTVPSGGRGVWFSSSTHDELRAWLMTGSDLVSGALLTVLGWRTLRPDRPIAWWAACLVGVWMVMAPVLFWAPVATAFYNDSAVGLLVIALAILIPGMPNMATYMQMGPPRPPGWSYNPSSWAQRWILIVLGFAGLVVSRYLSAYQLGYIDEVWDPFFGFVGGTQPVLDSDMSHMWPVSDAGLGAVAYSFEFLMGYMGGPSRWRRMPWMVTIFGILVIPLGIAHIALVMSQPIVVHHWCSMCLLAAAVMLPMIPLEIDEVVAMLQHVRESRRRGDRDGSLWRIFWMGGSGETSQSDDRTPPIVDLPVRTKAVIGASTWGFSAPPTLIASALLGLALLAAPAVFGVAITSGAADLAHLAGAAVVVVSVISMGEVIRVARHLDIVVGIALATVWFFDVGVGYQIVVTAIGAAVAALAWPRGRVDESYGTWDRFVV